MDPTVQGRLRAGPGWLAAYVRGSIDGWTALPWILFVAAFAVRSIQLSAPSLWFDETYTVFVARLPIRQAWETLIADGVHPPLYYALISLVVMLGAGEALVRLPSVLFGALCVPLLYWLARRWANEKAALIAAILLCVSPLAIWYSREARMYSMLAAGFIAGILAFERLLERWSRGRAVVFILIHAFAYLIHYFALFLPLVEFVFLAIRVRAHPGRLIRWTLLQSIAGVPLLGWIVALALRPGQYFGIGWVSRPGPVDLAETLMNFTFGVVSTPPAWEWFALAGCALLALLALSRPWPGAEGRLLTLLWAALPTLITFVISLQRPVYVDRFLIGSLPAFLLLVAVGLANLPGLSGWAAATGLAGVVAWSAFTFVYLPGQPKEAWREAGHYLEQAGPDEVIVPRVAQIIVPLAYYYHGSVPIAPMEFNRQLTSLDRLTAGKSGAWLVYWLPSFDAHRVTPGAPFDPKSEIDPTAFAWLHGGGPSSYQRTDFPGVTILHFTFPPQAHQSPVEHGGRWGA